MFRRQLRNVQVGSIPPALQHAQQLMAAGNYAEAAGIFEQFANGALNRNGPRAPWFFLQAGQARLMQGQDQAGMAHIMQGLEILAGRGQMQRLYHAGMRFAGELKGRDQTAQAQQIEDYLKKTLPAKFSPQAGQSTAKSKPVLPTTCPGCGGPIRSDEVEWVDDLTAECPYCGSAVRGQPG